MLFKSEIKNSRSVCAAIAPLLLVFLVIFIFPTNNLLASETGDLKVTVTGVRNSSGQIVVGLHYNKAGFPDNPAQVFTCQLEGNVCEIVLNKIVFGEYAIALYHDENSNNSLDHGFLGLLHKEGFGVSNNKRRKFTPPRYNDATFKFAKSNQEISIVVRY